jgi:hypothetical protein
MKANVHNRMLFFIGKNGQFQARPVLTLQLLSSSYKHLCAAKRKNTLDIRYRITESYDLIVCINHIEIRDESVTVLTCIGHVPFRKSAKQKHQQLMYQKHMTERETIFGGTFNFPYHR